MVANETESFDSNVPIRDAIAKGEIDLGLINHYYVAEAQAEDPDYPVSVHFPPKDLGSLVNVAGERQRRRERDGQRLPRRSAGRVELEARELAPPDEPRPGVVDRLVGDGQRGRGEREAAGGSQDGKAVDQSHRELGWPKVGEPKMAQLRTS